MTRIHLIICFLLFTNIVFANNYTSKLTGKVTDKNTGNTIPYVTIGLFNSSDSSLVTGTISNDEGLFEIPGIKEGNYYITFTFIGYQNYKILNFNVPNKKQDIVIGEIKLIQENISIEEITVNAKVSSVTNSIDKQVINVGSIITAAGGTAVDALKTAPSVKTNQDGDISIRGNANYIVLINGKPTGGEPSDVLKQTPANIIKKIELITNPSVKYSAEGTAGIINIILKKNADNGFNGIMNATVGTKDKYSSDLTLNFNKKNVNVSTGIEWGDNSRTAVQNYCRDLYEENRTHRAILVQNRDNRDKNRAFRFNVAYNVNENNSISYSLNAGQKENLIDIIAQTSGKTEPATTDVYMYNAFKFKQKPQYFTNNLNYTRKLNKEGSSLSINAYYSYINYYLLTKHYMAESDANYTITDEEPYMQNVINENYSNDYRFNIDYTLPVNKRNKIEMGSSFHSYKRFLDITFDNFDYQINNWVHNPFYTNKYDFIENVYSGYINYSTQLGGFNISAGLRAEYMDRELSQKTADSNYSYDNINWFPAFSISKNFENNHSLKLSLTNRINRPDEYIMNPFPDFEDDYFFSIGNPNLIPELSRSLELAYSKTIKKGSFSTRLYYNTTIDKIERKFTVGADDKLNIMFHNDCTDESTGVEISTNLMFTKKWTLMASVTGYHYKIKGNIEESIPYNESDYSWNAQLVSSLSLGKTTSIQIIGYYNSKTINFQGKISDYYFVDAAVKQSFFKDKLSVSIQAKDIFQLMNYKLTTDIENQMHLAVDFLNESPIFLFSVGFQISKFKKLTKDVKTKFDM